MLSSPYSPFFTSGLLSQAMPPRPVSPEFTAGTAQAVRRGSLPGESSTPSTDSSAFYVTLQPRRDNKEYLSFLSLDLAESQSMRSASLKRKASSIEQKRLFRFPRIAETPSPRASTPLRSRFSRDSLRTIPSPKPAPSITLPELPNNPMALPAPAPVQPQPQSAPPRLPSIPVLPALELPLASTSHTRTRPPPSKRFSNTTQATSSTVSTRARRYNRSEALAALEGRCASAPLLVQKRPIHMSAGTRFQRYNNFMSLSDDDESDEEDSGADDELDFIDIFNPLLEPEDVVLPSPSARPPSLFSSKFPLSLSSHRRLSSQSRHHLHLSAPASPTSPSYVPSSRRQRTRRSRTNMSNMSSTSSKTKSSSKDWFPLKSFIDLHNDHHHLNDDDDSSNWSWRSFIEVANVS